MSLFVFFISLSQVAQHVSDILKMGTWLPETCWATCKREMKDNTKVTSGWFLIHTVNCVLRFYLQTLSQVAQHVSDILKMVTWLPETCSATCKREMKDNTKVTSGWFLIHTVNCVLRFYLQTLSQVAQHVSDILKMGTWLPETCSATCKREMKDNTKVTSGWFLIHTVNCVLRFYLQNLSQVAQHVSDILKMGTWLPETCWATCKREIKDNTKVTSGWFLIHTVNCVLRFYLQTLYEIFLILIRIQ